MTNTREGRFHCRMAMTLALAAVLPGLGCGGNDNGGAAQHQVYLVGYVYDGASGQRLGPADITGMSVEYRDKVVHVKIEDDGRFVTTDPLPVWQDYSVSVAATGYRPFVSNNPGFDIPKALQMTEGASSKGTVQTFEYAIRLFPDTLQAGAVTITIEKSDALVTTPPPARAAGTIRLTPISSPAVQQSPLTSDREWSNDEDLLTQTITQAFTNGSTSIAAGTLVYGVSYQIAVFGVDGYQPYTSSSTTTGYLTAGAVTSMSLTLQPDVKAPLKILGTDADKCTPPVVSMNAYGAVIDLTFSEPIEPAGPTFAEDVDNGLSITAAASTTTTTCTLNTSTDPTKQERGTKAVITGQVLTLSFDPVIGLATMTSYGTTCSAPASITSVVYSLSNVYVQPVGDPVRKASVGTLLSQATAYPATPTTAASCPYRSTSTF